VKIVLFLQPSEFPGLSAYVAIDSQFVSVAMRCEVRGDLFIMLAGVRVLKHLSEFISDTYMTFDTLCNFLSVGVCVCCVCVFGGVYASVCACV